MFCDACIFLACHFISLSRLWFGITQTTKDSSLALVLMAWDLCEGVWVFIIAKKKNVNVRETRYHVCQNHNYQWKRSQLWYADQKNSLILLLTWSTLRLICWFCLTIRYLFDMSKLEAEELKHIEKSDVINWYNTYLRLPSPKCRQLAIHVWGCNTEMKMEEGEMEARFGKNIEDFMTLKKSADFYPSLCWLNKEILGFYINQCKNHWRSQTWQDFIWKFTCLHTKRRNATHLANIVFKKHDRFLIIYSRSQYFSVT